MLRPTVTSCPIGFMMYLFWFRFSAQELLKILGIKDFIPSDWIIKWLADTLCDFKITRFVCSDVIFLLAGPDTSNLNEVSVEIYWETSLSLAHLE